MNLTLSKFPTLEEAKKLCKKYKKPLNNHIITINPVAPSYTETGVNIGSSAQQAAQKKINENGLLVVNSPFKLDNEHHVKAENSVFAGDYVLFDADKVHNLKAIEVSTNKLEDHLKLKEGAVPNKDMYKSYLIMILPIHSLLTTINNE